MATKISITKEKLTEVKTFMKRMKEAGISYKKVILFGSYARGTARSWSDIDLCVISDEFGKDRHSERVRLMHIKDDETLDIEPHPYNTRDLANKWDPLASEIRKYGVSLS